MLGGGGGGGKCSALYNTLYTCVIGAPNYILIHKTSLFNHCCIECPLRLLQISLPVVIYTTGFKIKLTGQV